MEINEAASWLVIILSVTLTIFLIVAIILAVWLIRLTKAVNQVTLKTQEIVDNVESASETLKKAAGPLAAGKFIMNIADLIKNRKG